MSDDLKSFYDKKFSNDFKTTELKIIDEVNHPVTRFEAVIKYFPQIFNGGSILEVGSGNGLVANTLLKKLNSIEKYVGSEFSEPRLHSLEKNISDSRFSVMNLDVEQIPEKLYEDKYDAILMIALIEHLMDPLKTMKNINKLLKPGGFVYIDTPNIAKYSNRLKLLRGKFPSTASKNEGLTTYEGTPTERYDEGHFQYFTYRSLSLMLTQRCGFSSVKKLSYHCGRQILGKHPHYYLAKLYPKMFSELLLVAYK